ncbi:MAG: hypothetical protein R3Y07_04685, partial [Eubacteriales bacterium]
MAKRAKKEEVQEEEVEVVEEAPAPAATSSSKADLLNLSQKAALVVVSLGTEKASMVYQHMEPEDVEILTLEVAKLGYIDGDTTEEVLSEFYQLCMTNKAVTEGGLEYA